MFPSAGRSRMEEVEVNLLTFYLPAPDNDKR